MCSAVRPALSCRGDSSASTSPRACWTCPRTRAAPCWPSCSTAGRATRDEFVYRHRWQPGDMVFWDNRSLMHLAGGTPDHLRRRLDRTTIEGDQPF